MADVNLTVSVITLNMSGLNHAIKWQRLSDWIKKHDQTMLSTEDTFLDSNTHIDCKWKDGKIYILQTATTRKLEWIYWY